MMPTRLQDGLSISLLQWARTADLNETKAVLVRINDGEDIQQIFLNLQNAGLNHAEMVGGSCVRGNVSPEALIQVARCFGVCSVTGD
jgi:hypothetical protein